MRRKRIRHLMMPPAVILILIIFFITACEANFLENSENETFSLAKAKEYSLQNASVLKFPTAKPSAKSTVSSVTELEPLWSGAKYYEIHFPDKLAKTYEVPLDMGSGIGGLLLRNDNPTVEPAKISSSLLIQEFWQSEKKTSRQIIATIIGNDLNGEYSSAFTYMGSRASFSGFMVVSKVTGEIINIFQYINGERTVMYIKTDSTDNSKSSNEYYKGFRFLNIISTKSEEGNTIPGNCHMCGKETDVYPMYGHICAVCLDGSGFLDEVVVESERPDDTEDGGSGGSGSHCNCWGDCECSQNGNMMCMCEPSDGPGTSCSNCGELGCNGECTGTGGSESQWGENKDDDLPLNITLTGNTAFDTLCHNIMNVSNNLMKEIISNVKVSQINVEMRFSDTLTDIASAEMSLNNAFQGRDYTIKFREDIKSLSPSTQQVIILHELLHLKIYAMLKGRTISNMGEALPGFNRYYHNHSVNNVNEYYVFNEASHDFFAANYLDDIEDVIGRIAPNLDAGMAKWGSLTETEAFNQLSSERQDEIITYLIANNLYY